ncbi:hypothetical protein [Oceaniovalibus sp. ACAM 378]|jgi:hypothetical protein|uniref:hypothetical protein n=1 Tax=Oceaniovalibus sp. ACAM 378 TaxID=2599923 RepID=UPI0011DC650A|nr:hypothetical protein [Oceaniovalibus sp. ACAM 378]TYB85578.1 hypothetical protein FQ320_18875 [Oceaniovalibus sp. ACAM 378]
MDKLWILGTAALLGLGACTDNADLNRAAIGGVGLGAAAALTNNNVGTAVAIGAAGGALCDDVVPELCPR